jgi:hypothetical protein
VIQRILIGISLFVNVLFIVFIAFSLSRDAASVSFLDLDTDTARYTSGVCVVSVPAGGDGLVFGPVSFSLKPGQKAALQFSMYLENRSLNLAIEPLYDHGIISIEPTGYGLLIHALNPGTTVLQTAGEDGFNDIATITVIHE